MREIVFDTETTGFDPFSGDRLVEIGCLEVINKIPTTTADGTFHVYVNPQRDMPEPAFKVHGLSAEFLSDKPLFADVADDFLAFVGDAPLVAHNAEFDMRFINWELENSGRKAIPMSRSIDTLAMARQRFPGAQNTLDALCKRLGVDNSGRDLHGALIDAELLAGVYLEMMGGRQAGLELVQGGAAGRGGPARQKREPRPHGASAEEKAAHAAFLKTLDDPIWLG